MQAIECGHEPSTQTGIVMDVFLFREKEEQYYREMETKIKEGTESNIWKTVSSLTDLDNEFPSTSTMNSRSATPQNVITAAVDVMSESRRPKSPAEVIAMSLSDAKKASAFSPRKRTADVSRMKEVSETHRESFFCLVLENTQLLTCALFPSVFFFLLSKFRQKEKLKIRNSKKAWFWRFLVSRNEGKSVKISRLIYLVFII